MSTVGEAATSSRPRPPRSARRVGYLIGALVDGAILWPWRRRAVEPGVLGTPERAASEG